MFTRVLVVLEGATAARAVVGWTRRLLAPVGGDLRLLVVRPAVRVVVAGARTVAFIDQSEDHERRTAEVVLDALVARLREDGLSASVEVRFGKLAATVLAAAHAWSAEAIAIVDTPASRWHRWFRSDAVEELLTRSPVPVLVTRASGQRVA